MATTTFAALLESALHEAAPPDPRVHSATLARWMESQVALRQDVRLIDLRDAELARLGIDRASLVSTSAAHYPCTRAWATHLHGRTIGRQPTHGLVWNSRQTELHARALTTKPATRDLVAHHPAEVAVVWSPPATSPLLEARDGGLGPLDGGDGRTYLADLTAFLGIVTV